VCFVLRSFLIEIYMISKMWIFSGQYSRIHVVIMIHYLCKEIILLVKVTHVLLENFDNHRNPGKFFLIFKWKEKRKTNFMCVKNLATSSGCLLKVIKTWVIATIWNQSHSCHYLDHCSYCGQRRLEELI